MKTQKENTPWWDAMSMCHGKNKDNSHCHNKARKAYEIAPGNLFIPKMCWKHKEQEKR